MSRGRHSCREVISALANIGGMDREVASKDLSKIWSCMPSFSPISFQALRDKEQHCSIAGGRPEMGAGGVQVKGAHWRSKTRERDGEV